jgi:hypothetical protein
MRAAVFSRLAATFRRTLPVARILTAVGPITIARPPGSYWIAVQFSFRSLLPV